MTSNTAHILLGVAIGIAGSVVSLLAKVVATDWWRRNRPW